MLRKLLSSYKKECKLKPHESKYTGRSEIVEAVTVSWKMLARGERCNTLRKKAETQQTAAWPDEGQKKKNFFPLVSGISRLSLAIFKGRIN